MQRYKRAGCAAVMFLAAVSAVRSDSGVGASAPSSAQNRIPNLMSLLEDPDLSVRMDSIQRLRNLGEAARPALRRALATAPPQKRSEIDQVLLHIPWVQPGDSEQVEEGFTGYADLSAEDRCTKIDSWIAPLQAAGGPALLRVVLNDPSPAVRWEAAQYLAACLEVNAPLSRQVTDLISALAGSDQEYYLPAKENAPLLAVAGWALRTSAPQRSADLMDQAILIEQDNPSAFRGQMDFVFLTLISRANLARDHAREVALLREMAERTAWNGEHVPDAVTSLFAAQADYGPFPGFGNDLRSYREYLIHPEMVYTLARLAQRQGYAGCSELLNLSALLLSGDSPDAHFLAGTFLETHDWNLQAEREFQWALHLSDDSVAGIYFQVNIYFQLAEVADKRNDDLASAKYMETGLKQLSESKGLVRRNQLGQTTPLSADDLWAQVYYHYLRAAATANDQDQVKEYLEKFLSIDQDTHILDRNPQYAADIVPALQSEGHTARATAVFLKSYGSLKEDVNAAPDDPMPKNNLAWLCACSNLHLEEAAKLAADAVAASPDNAAFLDTQATVFMKQGQPAKALELETHALQLQPDDLYMTRQLEQFKAAGAKTK